MGKGKKKNLHSTLIRNFQLITNLKKEKEKKNRLPGLIYYFVKTIGCQTSFV